MLAVVAGVLDPVDDAPAPAELHGADAEQVHLGLADAAVAEGKYAGLLASDNTPLGRAVVHNEFRTVRDLFDRVGGGTGAAGLKAVAPTGVEPVTIVIPPDEPTETVSIVGLKLTEARVDGTSTTEASSGRPMATISNVMLQYRPAPPRPPARRK